MTVGQQAAGGTWLLHPPTGSILTPEHLPGEHHLIAATAREFVRREVLPALHTLETRDWSVARRLLRQAGELGLIGADVPEEHGGSGLDTAAAVSISAGLAGNASFSALFGAQANLAMGAILHFGTDAQKRAYLPRLAAGELVGAYALSESGSGSDALGAACRATENADGTFTLNGEKLWITNGGFADLFIVFAKVGGDRFTAFVVERATAGVATGREEHKMGLRGSSTTPLVLRDAVLPRDSVLGTVGAGHKVAFGVLNRGRLKLGAMCVGTAQVIIGEAAHYATTRCQFGKPLSAFGAIRHKLGEMIARTYASESVLYRVAGIAESNAIGALAIESSVAKVAGSEALDFVADENVQIHGGNGFVADYPAERHYRDARVNRIFEGTNEINRLLIAGMLLRGAGQGDTALLAAGRVARETFTENTSRPDRPDQEGTDALRTAASGLKNATLAMLALAHDTFGTQWTDEQEVQLHLADLVIAAFSAESAVLRATAADGPQRPLHADAAALSVSTACMSADMSVREAAAAMLPRSEARRFAAGVGRLLAPAVLDTVAVRRRLSDECVRAGRYIFP